MQSINEIGAFKFLVDFAKERYKQEMRAFMPLPDNTDTPENLQENHDKAVDSSLKLISAITPLSDEQNQEVKNILDAMLPSFNPLNVTSNAPAIGIDLGTTNCCLAVFRNKRKVEIIPSDVCKNSTPSYISFPYDDNENEEEEDSDEDVEVFVGEAAKDLAYENLKGTVFDVKRMLGRKFNDPRIQRSRNFWPFEIVEEEGQLKVKTGPSSTKSPVEITATLLKHLKHLADEYVNGNVTSAVVAVPAYYNATQRKQTVEACKLAGLNVLQLVNEPTAAAVAYNIHKKQKEKEFDDTWNSLIFDFGGGTFDVAVLALGSNKVHIKSVGGDAHLGGNDIDNNMVDYCIQEFKKQHGVDLLERRQSSGPLESMRVTKRLRQLKMECENKKQYLSQTHKIVVSLDAVHGSTPLVVPITREVFNFINLEVFQKCIAIMKEVLEKSGIDKKDIDEVVLVGGSCRIPLLQEMVSEFFEGKQLCRSIDADEAVAVGAAMLAFYAENVEVPNVLIQESETREPGGTLRANSLRGSFRTRQRVTKKLDVRNLNFMPTTNEVDAPNTFKQLDIGVYIDSSCFRIGTYEQTNKQRMESTGSFTELLRVSPELYLSDQKFLIGQEAHPYFVKGDNKYFNIYELLTSTGSTSLHRFNMRNAPYAICTHEIVAIFVKEALNSARVKEGGKMVVTIPFAQTSSFVERVRKSVEILGFNDVRVVSSLITRAMGSAEQSGCFTNMQNLPLSTPDEFMVVLEIQRESFAMGNVQISQDGIVNTEIRSDNITRCQEEYFRSVFRSLYDGIDITEQERHFVEQVLRKSIDELISEEEIENNQAYEMVFCNDMPPLILEMIEEILNSRIIVLKSHTEGSALLGASLLAASNAGSVSRILNPFADVDDFRTYMITLTTDFGGSNTTEEFLGEYKKTFEIPFERIRNGPKTYHLQLHQQFCEGGQMHEICRYYLTVEKKIDLKKQLYSFFRRSVTIKIWSESDADDMFELHAESKSSIPVKLTMVRQDTLSCKSACEDPVGSKFLKLIFMNASKN